MIAFSKKAALVLGALTMALAPVAAGAAPHKNLGSAKGGAKHSVNHGGGNAAPKRAGGNNNKPNRGGNNKPNRGGNVNINNSTNVNVSGNNRGGGGRNNGYNNNYNNNGHWDNDDNDFLEFVGKTAAITAGVSVVAAVIGSTTNERPDDCEQIVSNGQVYMNCNGTWYQPIQNGNQTQYQVIAPRY